ncbi:DUF4832 domain-containing protein [bacterium]|nr:DUF4832 domain-containing protein [bacterium]
MNKTMHLIKPLGLILIPLILFACGDQWQLLEYDAAKAPADNPMKGFMPYVGTYDFPHSLEYFYVGMAEIVTGPDAYDWETKLDSTLTAVYDRGHQSVFRVYLDYPRRPLQVPQYILDQGVTVTPYENHGGGNSPDYNNPILADALEDLILAMGQRYDGDPRIGFIQVGLLGHWGEFHTWPVDSLFATMETQNRILDAYETGFKITHCLVSQDIFAHEPMARIKNRRIGLHDDVFTLETHLKGDEHFYKRLTVHEMTDHWRSVPIGGELTPGQQSCIWDEESCTPDDYYECVRDLHATFLLNHRPFVQDWEPAKVNRAIDGTSAMGYQFYVSAARVSKAKQGLILDIKVENRGVAPFYYEWPVEVALLGRNGEILKTLNPAWDIRTIYPGELASEWSCSIPLEGLSGSDYQIALRIINPNPRGVPVKFANASQSQDWLVLLD